MADSSLTVWLKAIAGDFGVQLGLTDSDYSTIVDWTEEALANDAEQSPLTSAEKAVGRAMVWLRIMGLSTNSTDAYDRAERLYGQALDSASVYLPDISGLVKSITFYDPYQTTTDYDYV